MSITSSEKGDEMQDKDIKEVSPSELSPIEMAEMISEMKSQIDEIKNEKLSIDNVDEEEYDALEDYLEEPAVFFAYSYSYSIHSDFRKNREVLPPLDGFVKFVKLYRYSRKGIGRGHEVVSVCQTTVRSKSMAAWLRDHSRFNIKFFEKLEDAKSVDTTLAEKMAAWMTSVSNMNDHNVIERARLENIPLHNDIDKLRRELAQTLAEKDIAGGKAKMQKEFKAERDENGRKVEYSDKKIPVDGADETY